MRIATVLGGDGFVGRHVVKSLVLSGAFEIVRIADARASDTDIGLETYVNGSGVNTVKKEYRVCDITDSEQVRMVIVGSITVVHTAGLVETREGFLHDSRIFRVNYEGTVCVVQAVIAEATVTRLVYVSSTSALADYEWGNDSAATNGIAGSASTYGRSKLAAERYLLDACTAHPRLRVVCLRPHVVFGPGDPLATEDMLFSPTPLPGIGSGSKTITPIYVKNLSDLISHLASNDTVVGVLNVGDAHQNFKEYRDLLLSCRPLASDPLSFFTRVTRALTPDFVPLWIAWPMVMVTKLLDMLTLGTRSWKALKLTASALYYCDGANFRYDIDGYAKAGFRARFSWPEGVIRDLSAFAGGNRCEVSLNEEKDGVVVAPLTALPPHTPVFSAWTLRGLVLKNRIIKEATFEASCDTDGVPTQDLINFHEGVARGGAALTTVAYASVSSDGRSFRTQLLLSRPSCARLLELTSAVHRMGGKAMVQLTHAGSFADRMITGQQQISASAIFNEAGMDFAREMGSDDIKKVIADFATSAALAVECGFDAIQIHCGHGYLLSQFLSPYTNSRTDHFGCCSTSDRVRLPLEVCRAVRLAVGPHIPIVVKFNMKDGFAGGCQIEHAISFVQCLEHSGLVDLLIPSGGWVSKNGFFMLRGDVPLAQMARAQRKSWITRLALLMLGPILVPRLEWTPMFFSVDARILKNHLSTLKVCLLGGIDSLSAVEEALRLGFVAVAVARVLLREPGFVTRIQQESSSVGKVDRLSSACTHCNKCIVKSAMAELPLSCMELDEKLLF